jgi:hypothetical protein
MIAASGCVLNRAASCSSKAATWGFRQRSIATRTPTTRRYAASTGSGAASCDAESASWTATTLARRLRCRPAPTTKACRTATLVSGRPNSGVGANASTASASGSANSPSPGKRLAASLIRELAAEALACRQRVLELDRDLAKLLERHPDAALIALARRRIDVLWAMLHTRQPFQPNHPKAA